MKYATLLVKCDLLGTAIRLTAAGQTCFLYSKKPRECFCVPAGVLISVEITSCYAHRYVALRLFEGECVTLCATPFLGCARFYLHDANYGLPVNGELYFESAIK